MLPIHKKIKAALLAALASAIVVVAAAVADVYPDSPITAVVVALVPVIAGYLTPATPAA